MPDDPVTIYSYLYHSVSADDGSFRHGRAGPDQGGI